MSDICKTVLIKGELGPTRINESDYDKDKHGKILTGESEEGTTRTTVQTVDPALTPVVAPSTPNFGIAGGPPIPGIQPVALPHVENAPYQHSPQSSTVSENDWFTTPKGKKFILVNAKGEPITVVGVEAKGYDTEADAMAAAKAIKTVAPPSA